MNEFLLHYIWKYQLFNSAELRTTRNDALRILKAGEHNSNAGPDFFNARIECNDLILAGNVEVHLKSSDWNKHLHQNDKVYQNVILHVVYLDDAPVFSSAGEQILTLELKHRIPRVVIDRYDDLQQLQPFIPCQQHWHGVDLLTRNSWMQRMTIERLEQKCEAIEALLKETNDNWENAFYIALAKNFGFKINSAPFELIARSIPLQIFAKNRANRLQIEAILFGVAGFLQNSRIPDKYHCDLRKEFSYLKQKYNLEIIDVSLWKLLRLRPANFPQVRLAQFADLINRSVHLLSKITEQKNGKDIKGLMQCSASVFWDTHYTFDQSSTKKKKQIGDDALDNILINTVVPFLFLYGKTRLQVDLQEKALDLLEQIRPENNHIIRKWKALGTSIQHAGHSQALIQLKKHYCDTKQCLQCSVGLKILKEENGIYGSNESQN